MWFKTYKIKIAVVSGLFSFIFAALTVPILASYYIVLFVIFFNAELDWKDTSPKLFAGMLIAVIEGFIIIPIGLLLLLAVIVWGIILLSGGMLPHINT